MLFRHIVKSRFLASALRAPLGMTAISGELNLYGTGVPAAGVEVATGKLAGGEPKLNYLPYGQTERECSRPAPNRR